MSTGDTSSVPAIILCGGRGTRISEYAPAIPKPLVSIGDRPILWHIMNLYASHGHDQFILALGWLGEEIRRYFLDYQRMTRDFRIRLGSSDPVEYLTAPADAAWDVTCRDTGRDTMTGTRVRRAAEGLGSRPVMVTYGDGIGDVDINALLRRHRDAGRLATITVVQPPSRFGELVTDGSGRVVEFAEKPQTSAGAINGGFMVFEPEAIERYFPVDGDYMLEREPLSALAADGQLTAFEHHGFWQPMDTPRERQLLEDLWTSGSAPWAATGRGR
jgi:glucose-1-phosphate cytidylyltransferase